MKKNMSDYKKQTERLCTTPRSVQDLIPIFRISKDGIFQLEDKPEDAEKLFDKAYLFLDTNFATMDDYEKESFLKQYCTILNSLNVSFKISVLNINRNMQQVQEEIFIRNQNTRYAALVESFNRHIEDSLIKGQSGIEQIRIFVLTCKRQNADQARDFFRSIEANLSLNFGLLQSALIPLDAAERLRYLHAFYRLGDEGRYSFDFDLAVKKKIDWKDIIAPMSIKHWQDEYGIFDGITLQMDDKYVRALHVQQMPNGINPEIVQKLMAGSYHVILTCDVAAIPQDVTRKRLTDLYMQNERIIEKQQETRNKAQAWSSDVTYERRRQRDELENYLDIMNENDEKMFYVGLYAIMIAHSKAELENDIVSFCSIAEGEGLHFLPARWQQLDVLNTALPIGVRFCSVMYPLFTQPLCAITPFVVHELYHPEGVFYGINQVSKNVLVGSRKKLKNGNGFTLGVTGGGKGMDTKQEMIQVMLQTKDSIIVIDPQNEYRDIAEYTQSQFIDFGAGSGHYINPLDAGNRAYMESERAFLMDKTELMLGIFSQIMEDEISAQDKSIIGRCVRQVYEEAGKRKSPTLADFYHVMERQPEVQAQEMKLALELFVTGSLDMFSRQTNVNLKGQLTVFGIADLGKEQSGIGMLIMLESIRARIAENARKGIATWLYIDEFHNLAGNELSARYLEKIWKEVRKMGGLCTAITQNIADCLVTKIVETMLCNSEYISILNQSEIEIDILKRVLKISTNLLRYVENVEPGCGLLKFGDKYIPKDARLPKTSEMYRLFNTNFHEIHAVKRKELRRQVDSMPETIRQSIASSPLELEEVYDTE